MTRIPSCSDVNAEVDSREEKQREWERVTANKDNDKEYTHAKLREYGGGGNRDTKAVARSRCVGQAQLQLFWKKLWISCDSNDEL